MPVKIVDNTIHAAKVIIYKRDPELLFLMTKEADTGLFGFPGGAQDEEDDSIRQAMLREISEEIGLSERAFELRETPVTHEFVHADEKSPRFGKKGVLHLFLAEYNNTEPITIADELEDTYWLSEDKVLENLKRSYFYWPEVFVKTIAYLKD